MEGATLKPDERGNEISAYVAKRDAAVTGSLDEFIQFANDQGTSFSRREVAEIAMHKMRTAIVALPAELRRASKEWLSARGYGSFDDGDLSRTNDEETR